MIHHGDCLDVMAAMEPESVDAIVTDPPYSIGFMGRKWDQHPDEDAAFGYWLAGFTDGEGHFRVQAQARGTYSCAFSIHLRRDDRAILERIRKFLGCGSVLDEKDPEGRNPMSKLTVQAKEDCLRVVEVFARYPLRAKKLRDFLPWAEAVVEWNGMARGNRWHGRGDWSRLEALKVRVESARAYRDVPWSGHGYQDWSREWGELALRVLKPGGYMLAMGGTRTYHRMVTGLEDAGFEIRDCLVYAYASGFPKSKASLKPAWEPIVMARKPGPLRELAIDACRLPVGGPTATMDEWENDASLCGSCAEDAASPERPGTPATRGSTTPRRAGPRRNGSETSGATSRAATGCFDGTMVAPIAISSSTEQSGSASTGRSLTGSSSTTSTATSSTTGSRTCISCGAPITRTTTSGTRSDTETGRRVATTSGSTASVGRWPANVLLTANDDDSAIFDGGWEGVVGGGVSESGGRSFAPGEAKRNLRGEEFRAGGTECAPDSGTYSRFFLIPKADRADREPVLGGLPERAYEAVAHKRCAKCGKQEVNVPGSECRCVEPEWVRAEDARKRANVHPTVKPTELMRHLVRLVTPPGGTVLDPFAGSGSTLIAAEQEGFAWVGIEREAEYVAIAEARLNGTQRGLGLTA